MSASEWTIFVSFTERQRNQEKLNICGVFKIATKKLG